MADMGTAPSRAYVQLRSLTLTPEAILRKKHGLIAYLHIAYVGISPTL